MMGDSVATVLELLQTLTGLAWVFGCACRVHLMDGASHLRVRVSISVFAGGGLLFAASPWVGEPYHSLFETLAGFTVVWSLWVKAALWRQGVPREFGGNGFRRTPPA
jgi:hypothetical protein